jgi:hypothetical protein
MNVRGRDVLMAAAIDGVRRIRGVVADGAGGFSAVGLLLRSVACCHWVSNDGNGTLGEQRVDHARCLRKVRRRYGIGASEWAAIKTEDDAGWDFLTMAWAHSRPTIEAGGHDTDGGLHSIVSVPPGPEPPPPTAGTRNAETTPRTTPVVQPWSRAGYLKPCRSCGHRIYLHLDADGVWRPYESWADGHVAKGEWRTHDCR